MPCRSPHQLVEHADRSVLLVFFLFLDLLRPVAKVRGGHLALVRIIVGINPHHDKHAVTLWVERGHLHLVPIPHFYRSGSNRRGRSNPDGEIPH